MNFISYISTRGKKQLQALWLRALAYAGGCLCVCTCHGLTPAQQNYQEVSVHPTGFGRRCNLGFT